MGISPKKVSQLNVSQLSALRNVIRGYEAYTVLLSQSVIELYSWNPFVIGNKYHISEILEDDDFSNIGLSDNEPGSFIATGISASKWTNSTIVHDITNQIPSAIVLENAFNVLPEWAYDSTPGAFYISNITFNRSKTYISINTFAETGDTGDGIAGIECDEGGTIHVYTGDVGNRRDGILIKTCIEIRVYP